MDLRQGTAGDAAGDQLFGFENITGGAFNDTLVGDSGSNVLIGGAGADYLDGVAGDDLFVFSDGDGNDQIHNFQAGAGGGDRVDLSGYSSVNDFAAVQARATQVGADTLITLDGGDQFTLVGVDVNTLNSDDFLF